MTEIAAWSAVSGNLVNRDEVVILRAMDAAFMAATAVEQAEAAERAKTEQA
ncbi:hypothetical protein [Nitratireductor sp. StC3]|uniref:hypothetical protein n=1 Tax=Nitratireductor sp. StC3 TaxID=2126741 RepID=UPI0018EB5E2C|nr:hypothetical protein [Nitratireductor sp. StC3]